jgi:hypothetical protein
MTTFAFIKDNVVTEVKQNPDEDTLRLLGQTHASIDVTDAIPVPDVGWTLVGNTLTPPPGYTVSDMKLTKLAFRQRFTITELMGIYAAAATNVVVRIMMDNQGLAAYVDLSRSDTISGVGYLASLGLLTSDRMTAILTTPPTMAEHYRP